MQYTIQERKAWTEPKTGCVVPVQEVVEMTQRGIDPAETCDRFVYFVAVDRVTGCPFGMRFATEQQAIEWHAEKVS